MLSLRSGRYREEDARSQLLRIEAGAARVEVAHGALVAVERANTCATGGSRGSAALAGESSHRRRAANSLRRTAPRPNQRARPRAYPARHKTPAPGLLPQQLSASLDRRRLRQIVAR